MCTSECVRDMKTGCVCQQSVFGHCGSYLIIIIITAIIYFKFIIRKTDFWRKKYNSSKTSRKVHHKDKSPGNADKDDMQTQTCPDCLLLPFH